MINILAWDTKFFKRKIGELKIDSESSLQIKAAIKKVKAEGFQYIVCKIQPHQMSLIGTLESWGFYLSDIGVTWAIEIDGFMNKLADKNYSVENSIRVATLKDIAMLKKMIKPFFPESRFYNDPFFSKEKEEAGKLYQAWIENSVKKKVADIVFCIPDVAFITCKKTAPGLGEIGLVGVEAGHRGKTIGTAMMKKAMNWFKSQHVFLASVRTQLRNIGAMNYYVKLGCYIKGYDIVFAKIIGDKQ